MAGKICPKCKKEYPLDSKYFYRDKKNKDGFSNWCKECHNKSNKQSYKKRSVRIQAAAKNDSSVLNINFTGYEQVLDFIKTYAAEELRSPANQVLYWLKGFDAENTTLKDLYEKKLL